MPEDSSRDVNIGLNTVLGKFNVKGTPNQQDLVVDNQKPEEKQISIEKDEDTTPEDLAKRIREGKPDEFENKAAVYHTNDYTFKIKTEEGKKALLGWLEGKPVSGKPESNKRDFEIEPTQTRTTETSFNPDGTINNFIPAEKESKIINGSNYTDQQLRHDTENPKYKNMGADRPSLPIEKGQRFDDNAYKDVHNRDDFRYGPVETSSNLTEALKSQDKEQDHSKGKTYPKDPLFEDAREERDYQQKLRQENFVIGDVALSSQDLLEPQIYQTKLHNVKEIKLFQNSRILLPGNLRVESLRESLKHMLLNPDGSVTIPYLHQRKEYNPKINSMQSTVSFFTMPQDYALKLKKVVEQDQRNSNLIQNPSQKAQDFFKYEDNFASEIKAHQKALDSNAIENKGFSNTGELSNSGKMFFQSEDALRRDVLSNNEEINIKRPQMNSLPFDEEFVEGEEEPESDQFDTIRRIIDEQIQPLKKQIEDLNDEIAQAGFANQNLIYENQQLKDEIRELRGQNTPEQRVSEIDNSMSEILNGRCISDLTNEEKVQYLDLMVQRDGLNNTLSEAEKEASGKRRKKETIIKSVAFVLGGAAAFAFPATIPAVVAVTLGGRALEKLVLRKLETKFRNKSNELRYAPREGSLEELDNIDKKIKRNLWWADRLGEAAAVVHGGAAGYGIGSLVRGIFTAVSGGTATVAHDGGSSTTTASNAVQTPTSTPNITGSEASGLGGTQHLGSTLNASELGWNTSALGWRNGGQLLYLDGSGGADGIMNGEFLRALFDRGVSIANLHGQAAGEIFTQGLRRATANGFSNIDQIASDVARQLLNVTP